MEKLLKTLFLAILPLFEKKDSSWKIGLFKLLDVIITLRRYKKSEKTKEQLPRKTPNRRTSGQTLISWDPPFMGSNNLGFNCLYFNQESYRVTIKFVLNTSRLGHMKYQHPFIYIKFHKWENYLTDIIVT